MTRVDGEDYTGFGSQISDRDQAAVWPVIRRDVFAEIVESAVHLTFMAPEWGPAGQRLWGVLGRAPANAVGQTTG